MEVVLIVNIRSIFEGWRSKSCVLHSFRDIDWSVMRILWTCFLCSFQQSRKVNISRCFTVGFRFGS